MVTKSVTQDVIDLVAEPQLFTLSPAGIVKKITNTLERADASNSFALMTEALNTRRSGTIAEYIQGHMLIRRKQLLSNTPGISDERTTIHFILQGLISDERFGLRSIQMMIDNPPETIRDTQNKQLGTFESQPNTLDGTFDRIQTKASNLAKNTTLKLSSKTRICTMPMENKHPLHQA
eukprot:gb/GEZJ01002262.1/.p1 GENE.gb/GEZJ01002262.1/~~gb/GEZJ01002262.1/.p1  ORF type:complete len:178 (+),score=21.14 gb/GEZJ01002262.1/:264-797(+)